MRYKKGQQNCPLPKKWGVVITIITTNNYEFTLFANEGFHT